MQGAPCSSRRPRSVGWAGGRAGRPVRAGEGWRSSLPKRTLLATLQKGEDSLELLPLHWPRRSCACPAGCGHVSQGCALCRGGGCLRRGRSGAGGPDAAGCAALGRRAGTGVALAGFAGAACCTRLVWCAKSRPASPPAEGAGAQSRLRPHALGMMRRRRRRPHSLVRRVPRRVPAAHGVWRP